MDHQIAVIGGTTYDHIVYLPQLPKPVPHTIHTAIFHEATGSTGTGKALALTKLGMPNTLYSVVGDDTYGRFIKHYLEEQGVYTVFDTDPAGTERHINLMDEEGGRISIFVTQSSEEIEYNYAAIEDMLQQSSVIVLNIIGYCRNLIPLIREYDKPVWTDLHDYDGHNSYHQDFIEAASYIHMSSDNLPDYKAVMHELIAKGKELVICTHGKAGASLLTKNREWYDQPAIKGVPLKDSNGAGDSFFAGFLYAWLNEMPLKKCLQYGAVCGGYAITSSGLVCEALSADFAAEKIKRHFG